MRVLFISNIIGKKVGSFAMSSIMAAKELGYEYHLAANFNNSTPEQMHTDEENYGIHLHHIDFVRNPFNPANKEAYKQIVSLLEKERFDLIHCNTPIGGVIGRLAGKKCAVKKVIYQVHGFHFWRGAPLKNWLVFYPVEKWLAHYTDALITINLEDYERARGFRLRNHGKVWYVPGVGIDTAQYTMRGFDRESKRAELGFGQTDTVIISVGELNKNKNQVKIIEALKSINNSKLHLLLCGIGPMQQELEHLAKESNVDVVFLGYRSDVKELLAASDIYVFPSYREGLSRSLMEAMAVGLPCIVSKIRGNTDLIDEGKGGFLCSPWNSLDFSYAISRMVSEPAMTEAMREYNMQKIKGFDSQTVISEIKKIYVDLIST